MIRSEADTIIGRRRALGWSRERLAVAAGVGSATVARIERETGQSVPAHAGRGPRRAERRRGGKEVEPDWQVGLDAHDRGLGRECWLRLAPRQAGARQRRSSPRVAGCASFRSLPAARGPDGEVGSMQRVPTQPSSRQPGERAPDANIGVACGGGLIVVDADTLAGEKAVRAFEVPDTPTVRTGNGRHFYLTGKAPNRVRVLPGVDIRGSGGYVVGAGSRHPNGATYRWEISPREVKLAPAPGSLLALLAEQRKRSPLLTAAPGRIERGTRNATLFRLACSLRARNGLGYEELLATLAAVNTHAARLHSTPTRLKGSPEAHPPTRARRLGH